MWTVPVTAVSYSTDLPSLSQECLLRLSDVRRRTMVNILVYRDLQVFILEQRVGWRAEGRWQGRNKTVQGAGTFTTKGRTEFLDWTPRFPPSFCSVGVSGQNISGHCCTHSIYQNECRHYFFDATVNSSGRFLRSVWNPSDVTGDHPRHFSWMNKLETARFRDHSLQVLIDKNDRRRRFYLYSSSWRRCVIYILLSLQVDRLQLESVVKMRKLGA